MINYINSQMRKDSSPSKQIDLSADNIEIAQGKNRYDSKAILQENKFIKRQNEVLRKELQSISVRLDGQIKKRLDETKRKNPGRIEDLSQMELQNAYKKCQIYKKEASLYKKKLEHLTDDARMEDFERRISSYAKDNNELKQEIKQLKKITKMQEKGLEEVGLEGFSSVVAQNEKLKQQVRILKKDLDNYRRAKDTLKRVNTNLSEFDEKISENAEERRPLPVSHKKSEKVEDKIRKKLKTQQEYTEPNQDLTDLMHQKAQKDFQKLRSLANQKNRLREMVDNLKLQLAEKEKENGYLKEKISQLRKNNQMLQSQIAITRSESQLANSKLHQQKPSMDSVASDLPKKIGKKSQQNSSEPKRRNWKKQEVVEAQPELASQNSRNSNYPRKQERGSKMNNTIKWSHQHLSSKIKEIQILQHEKGHIKDIHVRYEKGQPKKYDQSGPKLKYQIFTCSEDEYIKNIEGSFAEGYLQYIVVTSNHRRVEKYGNLQFEQNGEGEHFEFQVGEREFPGGLFGQTDESGIRRLGCYIHKDN